jgi:CheY-like chemotaxis protein
LSTTPRILVVGDPAGNDKQLQEVLGGRYELLYVSNPLRALAYLSRGPLDGVFIAPCHFADGLQIGNLLQYQKILEGMPDGVVLLDAEDRILWANDCVREWLKGSGPVGRKFYDAFGKSEPLAPEYGDSLDDGCCPLKLARSRGRASSSRIRSGENLYFHLHAVPVRDGEEGPQNLIVTIRDVTSEVLQQQKLEAIHKAGIELADLTPEEVFNMSVEQRIDLLKANILQHTKDLLNFDVVEIRLLAHGTRQLIPLLSEGIEEEAARRPLFASKEGYGVTGYVAETNRSYLCEDTTNDPLYLEGCKGGRSSLTVPLTLHDNQVIGTFNVESPKPHAFTQSDMQFLEIYSRDVAAALNTLELLQAQQVNTAQASVEAIHREVALPVDQILNDAVNVMEKYIGHNPDVAKRLKGILTHARDIKQLIQKVGKELAPAEAVPPSLQLAQRPQLRGRRVLVVDEDEAVRSAAHNLLERFHCVVETAREGSEAMFMVRNSGPGETYDAIIADISLPDCTGFDLLQRLRDIVDPVPLILMTGFGYDPGHTIVKARRAGLLANAVLYKPFRLDQLLETVEQVIEAYSKVAPAS